MNNEFMLQLGILIEKVGIIQQAYDFDLSNMNEEDEKTIRETSAQILRLCHEEYKEWIATMFEIQESFYFRQGYQEIII